MYLERIFQSYFPAVPNTHNESLWGIFYKELQLNDFVLPTSVDNKRSTCHETNITDTVLMDSDFRV